ncbi:TOPRIM nucleotidyl transferase/hydrolase domain-containing protein [Geodermatophilus sp. FMUSA9-8]|uniref:TOPRIM nucleotidyl transferase/hydrolase domain-containing protein n=1 Tax=Geodermatophilus sp. FMUSA9-8 TaxID=3120155 RepID=UPI00300BA0C2
MTAPDPLPRAVVLVEGASDREAVLAAARALGRDLAAEGVRVVALGGAGGVARQVAELTAAGLGDRLRGLYDVGEEGFFRRALGAADAGDLAARGFFACVADLEEELVRAAGVAGVEAVVTAQRETRALATFRSQPAQRGRDPEAQLRRWLGTTSGRKARYARALVEHLDPGALPQPLRRLLAAT